jgi:hypothetical protein
MLFGAKHGRAPPPRAGLAAVVGGPCIDGGRRPESIATRRRRLERRPAEDVRRRGALDVGEAGAVRGNGGGSEPRRGQATLRCRARGEKAGAE